MRVALLVRALDRGGAERQLVTLATGLAKRGHEIYVLSFHDQGALLGELRETGVNVWTARKSGRWDMAGFMVRLSLELRRIRPDVLYSSLPAANIAACLAGRLSGKPALVWRVASSDMDLSRYHWFSAFSYRVEAFLASLPDAIVANSFAGREAVAKRGFAPDKVSVIWNGIRAEDLRPDRERGAELRRSCGLDPEKWTIGQVARVDPKKGYEDFLDAAGMLSERRSDVQFLCAGASPGEYFDGLRDRTERNGICYRLVWLGVESDMLPIYNAMDINTLSSRFGEGCPNAVGEAMACGVPCVVTDVGDSAMMVGHTGEVVPPGSPEQLMRAWTRLLNRLDADGEGTRAEARKRIAGSFGVERYINETETLLLSVQ
jgi:glycosyltransferase involved in cell wall biosynthesis